MKYIFASVLFALLFVTRAADAQQRVVPPPSSARRAAKTESFTRTELFFGRNKADGTEITAEEFNDFLNVTIAPEFPGGLTVFDGIGQFRGADKNTIQEKAKVLILLYPTKTRGQNNRRIERIRTAYKNRFKQQSVLRVDGVLPVCVSF